MKEHHRNFLSEQNKRRKTEQLSFYFSLEELTYAALVQSEVSLKIADIMKNIVFTISIRASKYQKPLK